MPSLSDYIDSLTTYTKNISLVVRRALPEHTAPAPFTAAILYTHLGDLIRDVDPSELGLFSLLQPDRKPAEIERVNFHGAIPLRRPQPRHDDASRIRDIEPELYAEAAMKYMDRYKLVRPMPRAQAQIQAILQRIPIVRRNIDDFNESLYQLEQARSSTEPDYKLRLEEEERHIRDLRAKLSELSNKRLALSKAKKSHLALAENTSVVHKPIASSKPNVEEDDFWHTPGTSVRAFKFSGDNMLVNEQADFVDVTAISFSASPVISKSTPNIFTTTSMDLPLERRLLQTPNSKPPSHVSPHSPPPLIQDSVQSTPQKSTAEVDLPSPLPDVTVSKIPVTTRVETIANKIWTVMNDLVIAAAATKGINLQDRPSTHDVVHYLEYMQEVTPSDELSPVLTSDAPTLQQVLTATLLIGLLASSSEYALPLTKVKGLLEARTGNTANPAQPNSSRIVYHCIAKRLLKIDRSGGGQIVRFDV